MNSTSSSQSNGVSAAQASYAILLDLEHSFNACASEEEAENFRHNAAIAAIVERRTNLSITIETIKQLYSNSISQEAQRVSQATDSIALAIQEKSSPPAINASVATLNELPGGIIKAIITAILQKDTFLTTEEIEIELKQQYPSIEFTRKQMIDSVKHARKRKEVVGLPVFKGNFPFYLHSISSFYLDEERRILKPQYEAKFNTRVIEAGYSLNPVPNHNN